MPATACEPVPLELATHLGGVDALEFGSRGAPLVVALQGKSANPDVIAEWVPAARLLAGAGWRVVVPNLHSNELTKPGAVASKDVTQVVRDIIRSEHNCGASCAVVMGKSWGGGEAHAARATQRTHAHSLTHACTTRTHTTNFTHARAARARGAARASAYVHTQYASEDPQAVAFAAAHRAMVVALVLVAPSLSDVSLLQQVWARRAFIHSFIKR